MAKQCNFSKIGPMPRAKLDPPYKNKASFAYAWPNDNATRPTELLIRNRHSKTLVASFTLLESYTKCI